MYVRQLCAALPEASRGHHIPLELESKQLGAAMSMLGPLEEQLVP